MVVLSAPANGTRNAAIAKAIVTTASAFDMLMFRIHESANCKPWLGAVESEPDPWLTSLSCDDAREQILTTQVACVARLAGIVDT